MIVETAPRFPADRSGVAILGCGTVAQSAHLPAYWQYGVGVTGVWSRRQETTAEVQERFPFVGRVYASAEDLLADPEVRDRFEDATLETVARGPEGYAHDLFLLYVAPWGFRPEEIGVPTQIWHGDEDAAVSPRIADFFAETIPDSRLHMLRGAGHLLLWSHAEDILRSLTS